MPKISVIIPAHKDEKPFEGLLQALKESDLNIIILSEGTRAQSLNAGAEKASGDYLWFLHADSILDKNAIKMLRRSIENRPDSLHYFDLAFASDGPHLMRLNAWGANLRSRLFGTPFGDQGLCISKVLFEKAGKFPENVPYGEDHVFVWHARQSGIRLAPVGAFLTTSARRYATHGWLKTTCLYQYLWIKQAIPEWWKLRKI